MTQGPQSYTVSPSHWCLWLHNAMREWTRILSLRSCTLVVLRLITKNCEFLNISCYASLTQCNVCSFASYFEPSFMVYSPTCSMGNKKGQQQTFKNGIKLMSEVGQMLVQKSILTRVVGIIHLTSKKQYRHVTCALYSLLPLFICFYVLPSLLHSSVFLCLCNLCNDGWPVFAEFFATHPNSYRMVDKLCL